MRICLAIAGLAISAAASAAQSVAPTPEYDSDEVRVSSSFAELRSVVRAGDTLIVTKADGTKSRGTLAALSDASLDLLETATSSQVTRFTESGARVVRVVRRDSSLDGMLYGAVSGFGPPFVGWSASGSGTDPATAAAVIGGSALVGAVIGLLSDRLMTDAITVYEAPPAATFEALRSLAATGDRLVVMHRGGGTTKGRVSRMSDTSLELEGVAAPLLLPDTLRIQLERPDRWWPSALAGAAIGLAMTPGVSYDVRCSNRGVTHTVVDGVTVLQSPCFNFDPPARDYVLLGLTGAAASGFVDWLLRDRTTVFLAPAARAGERPRIGPIVSRGATGVQLSVRF